MHSPLGQPIYAASHTSGYNHGCSDAQISDPSERYINQPERAQIFTLMPLCRHIMKALMLVLGNREGSDSRRRNSEYSKR